MNLDIFAPPTQTLKMRPYQNELVNGVLVAMDRGDKDTLVISPTASGKTVCFIRACEILISRAKDDEVVLILSHLDLLTGQTKEKFNRFSHLPVGILQGQNYPAPTDRVIVSTMQSAREFSKIFHYYELSGKKVKYIIIDEAHLRWSNSYSEILDTFKDAQVIDFTATPFKNKRLATGSYASIAFQISLQELIDQKYLVPPVLRQIVFDHDTTEKRCAIVMKTYLECERGKKAIMFMRTKEECKLLADALITEGVKAGVITDNVKGKKRAAIFEGYDSNEYDVLVSVNVLTAGFDSLLCECVFMFGTENPATYLQRVGRALRPMDGDSVKPHHTKQDSRIYVFGDLPTIESGLYEKHHNTAVKPKLKEECKTLEELSEFLEDNELTDTAEYEVCKASIKVKRIADKINMTTLRGLIEERCIPAEFLMRLAKGADTFKHVLGGDQVASQSQLGVLAKAGLKPPANLTSNEAAFIIHSMTGERVTHHKSDKYILTEGKFKGQHLKDIPWAYKSIILRKQPASPLARLIREFHPKSGKGKSS